MGEGIPAVHHCFVPWITCQAVRCRFVRLSSDTLKFFHDSLPFDCMIVYSRSFQTFSVCGALSVSGCNPIHMCVGISPTEHKETYF